MVEPRRAAGTAAAAVLASRPVPLPAGWATHVNEPQTEAELERLRQAARRGCPFGSEAWVKAAATCLGLESTLRPRGRPPKRGTVESPPQATLFGVE